jgi:hypothetical protein
MCRPWGSRFAHRAVAAASGSDRPYRAFAPRVAEASALSLNELRKRPRQPLNVMPGRVPDPRSRPASTLSGPAASLRAYVVAARPSRWPF